MLSIFFIFLFILSLILSKHLLGSFYTPFTVYSGVWSLAGFLLGLHWMTYPYVTSSGWIGITIAWLAILIGSFLGRFIRFKPLKFTYVLSKKRLLWAIMISNILVTVGILWKIKILISIFGSLSNVNLTELRIMIVHNTLQYPSLSSYLTSVSLGGVALAMVYFFNYGLAKGAVFIPLILVNISDWTYSGRAGLFTSICLIISSFIIYRNLGIKKQLNISKRSKLFMILIGVGMLLAFSFFILSHREGNIDQYSQFKNPSAIFYIPSLSGIYTYITSNIVSLGLVLSNPPTMDGGTMLISPILNVLHKFAGGSPVVQYYPFVFIPAPINTYSYLYEFYNGFGWIGVIIGPLVLGFFSQRFLEIFKKGRIFAIIPLLFLTTVLGYSITSDLFVHAETYISLFYCIIMMKWSTLRSQE